MSLSVKIPRILDVVDDDVMIETVKSGKYLIIAIPVKDITVETGGLRLLIHTVQVEDITIGQQGKEM